MKRILAIAMFFGIFANYSLAYDRQYDGYNSYDNREYRDSRDENTIILVPKDRRYNKRHERDNGGYPPNMLSNFDAYIIIKEPNNGYQRTYQRKNYNRNFRHQDGNYNDGYGYDNEYNDSQDVGISIKIR